MTDTPTPPQTAPNGAGSVPQPRHDAGQPPRASEAPQTAVQGFARIQGRCPACRGASLFLGAGGHVTCSRLDCPNPCAADDLLHGERQSAIRAAAERAEKAARLTTVEECRIVHSSRTSGLREALRILNAETSAGWDGPSVSECAAADRNWDVEQEG